MSRRVTVELSAGVAAYALSLDRAIVALHRAANIMAAASVGHFIRKGGVVNETAIAICSCGRRVEGPVNPMIGTEDAMRKAMRALKTATHDPDECSTRSVDANWKIEQLRRELEAAKA